MTEPFDKSRKQVPSIYRSMAPRHTGTKTMRKMTQWADQMAVPLEAPVRPEDAPSPDALAHRTIRIGIFCAVLLFGIVGLWMGLWPLATGAVAPGKVIVDTNRKAIQHLEGGIVKEILVREGESVQSGQVLVRMDATTATARRDAQRSQYITARATEARLIAERDGATSITFPPEFLSVEKTDPQVAKALDTQRRLFETRKTNLSEQADVLNQRINQSRNEISGLQQQVASASSQLALLNQEIAMVDALVKSGNAVRSRLLALQRAAAQIQGQRGEATANIARAGQQINQTQIEITNLKTEFLNGVVTELKDMQVQASGLEEQLRSSQDIVQRIEIKAPLEGRVVGLKTHTVGGVIQPGEILMEIVPTGDKLVIEAQVSPQDIDNVHEGMEAMVRLTAYKQRRIHPVKGTVVNVSADRFDEPQTGRAYYTARVEIPPEEMASLKNVELTPGMPAETLIVTGKRTMLAYLLDPIRYSFGRAFREE